MSRVAFEGIREAAPLETVFHKIWAGELPAYELFRWEVPGDDNMGIMAILDVHPAVPGHALIVPRKAARNWMHLDLRTDEQARVVSRAVAARQMGVLGVENVVAANFGDQVPQVHYHCIPSYEPGDVIGRMQPDSGRMQERADDADLAVMRDRLAFPPLLANRVAGELRRLIRLPEPLL